MYIRGIKEPVFMIEPDDNPQIQMGEIKVAYCLCWQIFY